MKRSWSLKVVGAALAGTLLATGVSYTASAADRVGVAAAVRKDVSGQLGGAPRALASGDSVFRNERVSTGVDSSAQLMFLDETNLSIGPSSQVVLDRFVYNPDGTVSDLGLNATKGAFRFISGSSRPQNYNINTPVATIGVRGTILDIIVEASRAIVILVEGASDVCVGGSCTGLVKPGSYVTVHAGGRVEGPRTWDGSLRRILGRTSFPLYGNRLDGDLTDPVAPDDNRSIVDEVEARHHYDFYRNYFDYPQRYRTR